ncbi:DUF6474 family protein [Saccharopolyspora sp. CA-218241]|uniref:DUF6474 family protein n=1 Tax=Saccharopolyspora sp. CA-218241 TaxID=3240027 RepID=UPI003D9684F1
MRRSRGGRSALDRLGSAVGSGRDTRLDRAVGKQRLKAGKREVKLGKQRAKAQQRGELGRFTPGNAKKVVGVTRVLAPVVAPYAMWAATAVRENYDRFKARRMGISADQLGSYSGRGAGLHARIDGDAQALAALRTQSAGRGTEEQQSVDQFAERTNARLTQLISAVRAAERVPAGRRRATHRSVHRELNRIEKELMTRFGL